MNSTKGSLAPKVSAFINYVAYGANTLTTPGNLGIAAIASFSFLILSYSSYYARAISAYKLFGYYYIADASPSIVNKAYT